MNNRKTTYIIISILLCLIGFIPVYADSPCSTFFIKATLYTKSGNQESIYLTFDYTHSCFKSMHMYFNGITEYETIHQRIPLSKVDLKKINNVDSSQYNKILAVNKSLAIDSIEYLDYQCYYSDLLPTANKISSFSYYDPAINKDIRHQEDIISYAEPIYINLDTINLITLDSILWCDDFHQIQWLNKSQIKIIEYQKIIYYFSPDAYDDRFQVYFFIYDSNWTKDKILNQINLDEYANDLGVNGGINIFSSFKPELQKAVNSGKIIYFVRGFP